jgi:hypothetical protein
MLLNGGNNSTATVKEKMAKDSPAAAGYTTDLHSIGQYIRWPRMMIENLLEEQRKARTEVPSDPQDLDGLNF